MDITEILAAAKPAERTIRICLRGDLVAQWEVTADKLIQAVNRQNSAGASLAGSGAAALSQELEALQEQMEPFTVPFKARGLAKPAYQALVAAHPPRKGDDGNVLPDDLDNDVDMSTFPEALIRAAVYDPALDAAQWDLLISGVPATAVDAAKPALLSDAQFEVLFNTALAASRRHVDIPFSSAALQRMMTSGGGSNVLSDSGFLSDDSAVGNPSTASLATPTDD
jgi:hypothetical protein